MTHEHLKLIECKTAAEFWTRLAPENPLHSGPHRFIYRGQSDAEWALIPTALPRPNAPASIAQRVFKHSSGVTGSDQIWLEHHILRLFVDACDTAGLPLPNDSTSFRREVFDDSQYLTPAIKGYRPWPPEGLFDLLALAQHHRLPTRLLDWTRRAHVAVYFAAVGGIRAEQISSKRLAVWALDLEKSGLMRDLQVVRVPGSTSRNLAPQEGLFTLLREHMSRNEKYVPREVADYVYAQFSHDRAACPLWKITVPSVEAPALLERCAQHGVTGSILFPGYDGAAVAAMDAILSFDRARDAFEQAAIPNGRSNT